MSELIPLAEIANRRTVNRVPGLETTIRSLNLDLLVQAYKQSMDAAPRRPAKRNRPSEEKRYFPFHSGKVKRPTNRLEEHLAIGLVDDRSSLTLGYDTIQLLYYQLPLKAADSDLGVGKVDLFGHSVATSAPWVIELKVKPAKGRGDTPLRALLEALTYSAVLEANWPHLTKEASAEFGITIATGCPDLIIAATRTYWTEWRTSLASGNWLKAFSSLIDELERRLNRTIRLVDLGDVKAKVAPSS